MLHKAGCAPTALCRSRWLQESLNLPPPPRRPAAAAPAAPAASMCLMTGTQTAAPCSQTSLRPLWPHWATALPPFWRHWRASGLSSRLSASRRLQTLARPSRTPFAETRKIFPHILALIGQCPARRHRPPSHPHPRQSQGGSFTLHLCSGHSLPSPVTAHCVLATSHRPLSPGTCAARALPVRARILGLPCFAARCLCRTLALLCPDDPGRCAMWRLHVCRLRACTCVTLTRSCAALLGSFVPCTAASA